MTAAGTGRRRQVVVGIPVARPEQVRDRGVRPVIDEIADPVAAVQQPAALAVDVAERRLGGDDAFEAGRVGPRVGQRVDHRRDGSPASGNPALGHRAGTERCVAADVELARPPDPRARVGHHLAPLGDPAGQPADREQDREHADREAERAVDEPAVEVDVRVELALDEVRVAERDLLELAGDVEQLVVRARASPGSCRRPP